MHKQQEGSASVTNDTENFAHLVVTAEPDAAGGALVVAQRLHELRQLATLIVIVRRPCCHPNLQATYRMPLFYPYTVVCGYCARPTSDVANC